MLATEDRERLSRLLEGVGYRQALIRFSYPVWVGRSIQEAGAACFGRETPQDMTTSTLTAEIVHHPSQIPGRIEVARSLAAPAALFLVKDQLQVWNVGVETEKLVSSDPVGLKEAALGRLQSLLDPENLLSAKRGTRQLPLFPVDVSVAM